MTPISQGTKSVFVAGVELKCHTLDDGQRVIEKEGMDQVIALMMSGTLTVEEARKAQLEMRGLFKT